MGFLLGLGALAGLAVSLFVIVAVFLMNPVMTTVVLSVFVAAFWRSMSRAGRTGSSD